MSSDCGYQGNGPCPLCEDAEPLPEVSDFWKWVQSDSCIPYQDDVTVEDEIQVRDLYHLQQRLYSEVKSLRTANVRLQSLADEAIKERDKAVERELAWTARAEAAEGNTLDAQVQELVAKISEENDVLRRELSLAEELIPMLNYAVDKANRRIKDLAEDNTALRDIMWGYEQYVDQLEECFKQLDEVRMGDDFLDEADVEDDDQ